MGLTYPLGKKIYFDHPDFAESYKELEIVGVVQDFHFRSMHQAIGPFIFRFYRPWHFRIFIKISPGQVRETLGRIEGIFAEYAPQQPFDCEFLDDTFQQMYQSEIQLRYVFSLFGTMAIFISCMGLFGLASSMSEQKTKEIGIRKVFGATVSGIVFSLSKELTQGVMLANLITWPVVYLVMNRWLRNFAYRINLGLDVFVFSALLTLSTALLTVSFKAVKTASANPVDPLRHE
jgi:putative ABC transport system permease protein